MKDSFFSIKVRGVNEGHPPTTAEWNEHEARQGEIGPQRSRPAKGDGKPRQKPGLPMLTDQQIASNAKWLYADLVLLIDAFDAAPWDDRWSNRLMAALLAARNTIRDAATRKHTDGMARLVEADEAKETAPAAGGSPQEGSGGEAGDA